MSSNIVKSFFVILLLSHVLTGTAQSATNLCREPAPKPCKTIKTWAKCTEMGCIDSAWSEKKKQEHRDANPKKNRSDDPGTMGFTTVTMAQLMKKGNDRARFQDGTKVELVAFMMEARAGSPESCNCGFTDDLHADKHIYLVAKKNVTDKKKAVIAEVAPRMREALGKQSDWTCQKLNADFQGQWVKVRGYMFYDKEHEPSCPRFTPKGKNLWRNTCWEIHPITSIEVTTAP